MNDSSAVAGEVQVEDEEGVLVLRLANQQRANALTDAMLDRLTELLQGREARAARCVLLTGAGARHFSSGADLRADSVDAWIVRVRDTEHGLHRAAAAVVACPRPVIAVMNGDAYGGGLDLAMACDWRIARRGARFAMTPARLGIVYAAEGLRRFVETIGSAHTRELFLTGRPIDSDWALGIGMVNHVVEAQDLWSFSLHTARAVAANAPIAVEGMRAVLRALVSEPEQAEARAQQWRVRAFGSTDLAEGISAFRAKRPPGFKGR